jgi:hypothetical protein
MSQMNFIVILVVILVVIYFMDCKKEGFNPNSMYLNSYTPEPVDYSTRKQDCNELTWSPDKCVVDTVIPPNVNVCTSSLSPITNNQKECNGKNKKTKKNPTVSLRYDFDLLPSFNNAQQNDIGEKQPNNMENSVDLETDIRSLNSLENDLISNY